MMRHLVAEATRPVLNELPGPPRDRDTTGNGTLDERFYALQDANWNVTALTDASGVVQERYAYDPYGSPLFFDAAWVSRSSSSYDWVFLFSSYIISEETGLYHARNRCYHSKLGEWIQRDLLYPISDINMYCYVNNSPINYTDPLGLEAAAKDGGDKGSGRGKYVFGKGKELLGDIAKRALANCPTIGKGNCIVMHTEYDMKCPPSGEFRFIFGVYEADGFGFANADWLYNTETDWTKCKPNEDISVGASWELCCDKDRNLTGGEKGRGSSGDWLDHEVFYTFRVVAKDPSDPAGQRVWFDDTSDNMCIKCCK